jgi:hypothetical protein
VPWADAEILRAVVHGATMPFRNYNVDPEHIEAMRAAFRRVCDVLQLNGNTEDPLTELVVLKIVELAKAGELDPERLCIDVLAELETPPPSSGAGRQELADHA